MTFEDLLKQGPPQSDKPINTLHAGLGQFVFTREHREELLVDIRAIKYEIEDQRYDVAYRRLKVLEDRVSRL